MTGSTDVGIGLALLSTTAYNYGLIVEKQALGQLPAIGGRADRVVRGEPGHVAAVAGRVHADAVRARVPGPCADASRR